MKVFIVTEGSQNIGFGHITRCVSLYQAFEEKGIIPKFIINGDESISDFINSKNYLIFNWIKEKRRLYRLVENADIAIIDSYLAKISFYKNLSNLVKLSVYLVDVNEIDYPKGVVVNGNICLEEVDYPVRAENTFLLGTKYIPLRKEFWHVPKKEITDKVKSVMITFGGSDVRNMTPWILRLLRENFPDLTKYTVIGKAFPNLNEINKETDNKTVLVCSPNAKKMKEIMLESDIAISSGGQTVYELARIGIPTIGIAVADNQLSNVKAWKSKGFFECVCWHSESNLMEKLKKSIEYLKDVDTRKTKSAIGREIVDGQGSLNIVKKVLSIFLKNKMTLREATIRDSSQLFDLSNDPVVRKNSYNQDKIEWHQHLKWLKRKLLDKDHVFFVVTDNLNKFYGQVRFDIDSKKEESIINISLKKNIRGLGLSSFVIDKSIDDLLKIKRVKLIKAYIKEENISSIKSFERANFRFLKNFTYEGTKSKIYVRDVK